MNLKETVDAYLLENFQSIEDWRTGKKEGFQWEFVLHAIYVFNKGENSNLFKTGRGAKSKHYGYYHTMVDYVRKRFRVLREIKEKENTSQRTGLEILESTPFAKLMARDSKRTCLIELENKTSSTTQDKFVYASGKESKETGKKEFTFTADTIPTEEQIVEHFNIDTKKWKIVNIYHKTSFGGKYSITVQTNLLKGVESIDYSGVFENFIKENNLKILSSPTKTFEKSNKELNCTVVINLADLHLGKLVSESETGDRYNIDIAKDRFLTCIKYLSQKAYQCYGVKKFILSTLGDTLHTDNLKSQTTAGTYVESDTRASKTFQTALELITQSVDILKEYAPEVEFININGNHCELSEQYLGIALKAFYRNDKSVKVNSDPKNRKHILIGTNLLTWNHGDTNIATLPLTIATEIPEMWGKSTFRLVQLGHLHSTKKRVYQSEDEFNGVIVRHFSSITSTDFWHDKNNFRGSQKRGTALVFSDVESGIIGEFYKTV